MLNQSQDVDLDRAFQALADPTRRAMLDHLSRGPASVGELAAPMAMTLAAVMQHLRVLENGGLVTSRKVGRVRICELDNAALGRAEEWIADRRAAWSHKLDRLGEYLTSDNSRSDFTHSNSTDCVPKE
ncbi:MAG: helix-turn-helix transcriptional regulator [Frondihabitans sp.]|nr:helix-turn-helix transcriptional regulator [Frondihabitans sp.]